MAENASLDDVLNLKPTDLLARRLQTIVSKKLGFKTPYQARQAVIHGHIMVGDRKVDIPSYTVTVAEEDSVHFSPESKIPEMLEKTKAEAPKVEAPAEGKKLLLKQLLLKQLLLKQLLLKQLLLKHQKQTNHSIIISKYPYYQIKLHVFNYRIFWK